MTELRNVEADLARIVGDVPAHMLAQGAQRMVQGLRQFAGSVRPAGGANAESTA